MIDEIETCDTCAFSDTPCFEPPCNSCNFEPDSNHWTPGGTQSHDSVDHPAHYTSGGVECIDAIKASLTPEEYRGYCKGNIIKYIWRERHKGQDESVAKAIWYAKRLIGGGE